MFVAKLGLDVALFGLGREAGRDMSLPGRSSEVGNAVGIFKHVLGLLQGLAGSLGEHEEDVDKHGDVEDTKDEVGLVSVRCLLALDTL